MEEVTLGLVVVAVLFGAYMIYQHEYRLLQLEDDLYALKTTTLNGEPEKPKRPRKATPPPGATVVRNDAA